MVEIETLVFLVDLGSEALAQCFDLCVTVHDDFTLAFRHLNSFAFFLIRRLERLSWLLETSQKEVRSLR